MTTALHLEPVPLSASCARCTRPVDPDMPVLADGFRRTVCDECACDGSIAAHGALTRLRAINASVLAHINADGRAEAVAHLETVAAGCVELLAHYAGSAVAQRAVAAMGVRLEEIVNPDREHALAEAERLEPYLRADDDLGMHDSATAARLAAAKGGDDAA